MVVVLVVVVAVGVLAVILAVTSHQDLRCPRNERPRGYDATGESAERSGHLPQHLRLEMGYKRQRLRAKLHGQARI